MLKVFEDHEAVIALDHDFLHGNDVDVIQRLQEFDLSDRCNRELDIVSICNDKLVGIALTPSRSPSIRIFLRATILPVYTWMPLYTFPYVPLPTTDSLPVFR